MSKAPPKTVEERQERRMEIAADRISRELWDFMQDIEKSGGNGITAALNLIGSTSAAVVDRAIDKKVAWNYLASVMTAARNVQKEVRAELDARRTMGEPEGNA